jgi:hypothetical protein
MSRLSLYVPIVLNMTVIVLLKLFIEVDNDLQMRSRQRLLFVYRESMSSLHDILDLVNEH